MRHETHSVSALIPGKHSYFLHSCLKILHSAVTMQLISVVMGSWMTLRQILIETRC